MKCYRLNSIDEHVKNYAPQILALSGLPGARPALLHLANLITKNHSLLISGEIYPVRRLNKQIYLPPQSNLSYDSIFVTLLTRCNFYNLQLELKKLNFELP